MDNTIDVIQKLDTLLGNVNKDNLYGQKVIKDDELMHRMFEFIIGLEPEQLNDGQINTIMDIIDDIEFLDEEDSVDEVKKVKIASADKITNKKVYKKNKTKIKMAAKKYRKSTKGKMMAKKAKKMNKMGRTATGKKKVSYR